jgi:hypothetical protein
MRYIRKDGCGDGRVEGNIADREADISSISK